MYNDYDSEHLPYRNILIKLIIIVTVILVAIWFYYSLSPKNSNGNSFYKNLNKFKNSALKYYTSTNITTKKVTLGKSIETRNINELYDTNNNVCSNNSYFKLTKNGSIYNLRVSLTCNKKTDYIDVLVGHFDYCKDTYLCEKKTDIKSDKDTSKNDKNIEENKTVNSNNTSIVKDLKERNDFNDFTNKNDKKEYVKRKSNPKSSIEIVDTTGDNKLYEYKKYNYYWTEWQNEGTIDCNSKIVNCSDDKCNAEEKIITKNDKIVNKNYQITSKELVKISSSYEKACHNYVVIDSSIYELISDNYDTNGFINAGIITSPVKLSDTFSIHYDLVDIDIDTYNNITYHYKKTFYPGNYKLVNNINTNCSTIKKIITYKTEDKIYNYNKNSYENTCYKLIRYKTKTNIDIKWSSYNDLRLLNDGYFYTGMNK